MSTPFFRSCLAAAALAFTLLPLQISAEPEVLIKPEAEPKNAAPENPEAFYPAYLRKLDSLPENQKFSYAAGLPILNNPALAVFNRKLALEKEIRQTISSGLGHRHPRLIAMRRELKDLETNGIPNSVIRTREILEGKKEPSLVDQEINHLRKQLRTLQSSGLGPRHPAIKILKKQINTLEEECDQGD